MGLIKRNIVIFGVMAMTRGGCTYANNKSWGDMTPEEQEEVREIFEEHRNELEKEEDFSEDMFAQYILDQVEKAIEIED